ncbi:protein of unknown function [Cupriavidus taiwanensis]|nr:protein of unknown function [Cupriavidus taiwanensis]SOZ05464.1 hypothetical protein CBM2595_A80149 [Cupriavidus taiwanensis]SPD40127.1 protein of unknown function [Cupriavidus taiwanensis]
MPLSCSVRNPSRRRFHDNLMFGMGGLQQGVRLTLAAPF